jgi:GNAT superfamily N-acetyltransferase
VDIRELDPRDQALVRRFWEIGKAAEADRPFDFYPAWESAWVSYSQGREDCDMVLLGAFVDDVLWGTARVDLGRYDNLHLASVTYYTHPERQRRGIGRALAQASYDVARRDGRTTLMTEAYTPLGETSPGLMFGKALGFTTALEDGMKVVDLVETEPRWEGLETAIAASHADYRIVTWRDSVPEEYVDDYCRLGEMFLDEAPMGELEVEPERWDHERVRAREQRNAREGRHDCSAGVLAPDGTLVALTEVIVGDFTPWRGIQSGTLVAPDHRGHRLGLAVKLANHRQLREHFRQCRVLLTGNADVNAPMNAVNETLGYREVERCVEMQRDL